MFRVCAYFVNSVSRNDFEQREEALNRAAEICSGAKALSVEIQNPTTGEVLMEFYPDER